MIRGIHKSFFAVDDKVWTEEMILTAQTDAPAVPSVQYPPVAVEAVWRVVAVVVAVVCADIGRIGSVEG